MKLWNILWTDHGFLSYLAVVTFEQCLEHFPVLASSSFGRQYWDRPSPWLSCVGRHWPQFHEDCLPECSLALVRDKVKLCVFSVVASSLFSSKFPVLDRTKLQEGLALENIVDTGDFPPL